MLISLKISGEDIKKFRKEKGLSQVELGKRLGVHKTTIINYEKGDTIPASKQEILVAMIEGRMDQLLEEPRVFYPEDIQFIELPFVSIPARAGFVETPDGVIGHLNETRPVLCKEGEVYYGQILIEVDGDSMEPTYPPGTVVRCKQIDPSDWDYLQSGVYAIVYASSFVIKRIKDNNYQEGYLTLHSDNTETGGKINVKAEDLRQVWKVLRIVDAPAR
jgi:phage repressor protein C with HTH and peptisase S24 domain